MAARACDNNVTEVEQPVEYLCADICSNETSIVSHGLLDRARTVASSMHGVMFAADANSRLVLDADIYFFDNVYNYVLFC